MFSFFPFYNYILDKKYENVPNLTAVMSCIIPITPKTELNNRNFSRLKISPGGHINGD